MAKSQALSMFEQSIRSKKSTIKSILDSACNIGQIEQSFAEYAAFTALSTLIEVHNAQKINDLSMLSKYWQEKTESQWICSIIKKYQFQLKQKLLNQENNQNQNSMPEPKERDENKAGEKSVSRSKRSLIRPFCFN